jgi:hypothetical protein
MQLKRYIVQKYLFSLLFICPVLLQGEENQPASQIESQVKNSLFLLTEDRKPSPLLQELLSLTGIEGTLDLDDVVQKTQEQWIAVRQGQNQIERRDLVDSEEQKKKRDAILAIAEKMGLFAPSLPALTNYKYGICLGAFLGTVRERLHTLVELWKKGIRFETLVFLGGERDLRKAEGEPDSLSSLCNESLSPLPFKKGWTLEKNIPYATEYDMMKIVWAQVEIPEDMKVALENKVVFVNASKGNSLRPSTGDTYQAWLNDHSPIPGTVLAVSSPLFWSYQQLVAENILGDLYLVETVAPAAEKEKQKIVVVLDTLAKCLFEASKQK